MTWRRRGTKIDTVPERNLRKILEEMKENGQIHGFIMNEWLEVSSVSIYEQYQARRANIRFRKSQGHVDYVYTMNGSGLATPRVFIAIIENYQTKDGKIQIPDVLRPYMDDQQYIK